MRHPVPALLAVLLVIAQIGYPLTDGTARDRITVVIVLLSAGTALAHAAANRGIRYAMGFLVIVSGVGLLAEMLGVATGIPFGCYEYAEGRIGPALAGVPLLVPLAWTGGMYPVWIVAGIVTRRTPVRVVLTTIGAVGWDLYLDPQMVADGQWTWCDTDSGLPGLADIPRTNYLGWCCVGLLMALLLAVWDHAAPAPAQPRSAASLTVPVAVFLWTWLGSLVAHAVFLDLPSSAWYGALGMSPLGVPLLIHLARHRSRREQ
ncbi:carotenoid biosynthesis protein [Nocardia xishanensis]|uniref:carotenoid biosynthesis protein n=1 Tax=Nocardia xishanensis TaxID=238964 RepID=UPI000835BCDB|nr:carotenoid biosynthesis protein [Nocardia xishanensis]